MASQLVQEVEFIGGPVDGHREVMSLPLEVSIAVATIPLGDTRTPLAALLQSFGFGKKSSPRPVAVYELLKPHRAPPFYRFRVTFTVSEQQLRRPGGISALLQLLHNRST